MSSPPRAPKYRHYKPKDLAVVRIDGRDIYLGKHGTPESHERYRRVIAEWLSSGVAPPAPSRAAPAATISVSEVILAFWRFAETHYRRPDGTPTMELESYKVTLRPLRELYGSTAAADFGPRALKAVRQAMIDAGLARKTVNQRVRRVVRVFGWAVENELVPPTVHHGLRAVRGLERGRTEARETEPVKPVAEALVNAIRPHVARQVWAMVELQRHTGMRPGEAVIMRTGDIDRRGSVWTYTPTDHKTSYRGHARTVYLGPKAQEILSPWLRADPDAYLFSPAEAQAEQSRARRTARKTPLTPSQRARTRKARPKRTAGARYEVHSYGMAIRRGCDRAFPHPTLATVPSNELTEAQRNELHAWQKAHRWHPHQLRHNAATRLRRDFGLDVARAVLGHRTAIVTEVYAEVDQEKAVAAMKAVG